MITRSGRGAEWRKLYYFYPMDFMMAEAGKNRSTIRFFMVLILTYTGLIAIGNLPFLFYLNIKGIDHAVLNNQQEMIRLVGENVFLVFQLLPFVVGLIVLLVGASLIQGRTIITLFTARSRFSWQRFFTAFCITLTLLLISLMFQWYSGSLRWNLKWESFVPLLVISLLIVPIQATFEEVLFRGFLFQKAGQFLRTGFMTVLFTGVLFGLMHMGNPEVKIFGPQIMAYYILAGLFLGFLVLMDDGLELAIGYHVCNNLFSSLLITNEWQVFRTDALFINTDPPLFEWNILTGLLLQFTVFFLVFRKKFHWKQVKEKLFSSRE